MPTEIINPLDKYGGSFARWFEDWSRTHIVVRDGRHICEECGGTGSTGTPDRYTDPCTGGGEEQWRGYLPTTWCHVCEGTGVWPPLREGAQ